MTIPYESAASLSLEDDDALEARVADLLGTAIRRQWWTMFLDEHDRQFPLVMPMADYPEHPDEPAGGDFACTAAELLALRLSEICRETDAAAVLFAWERPGGPETTAADRAWALGLGAACRERGVRVRAQFLVHDDGVRMLASEPE